MTRLLLIFAATLILASCSKSPMQSNPVTKSVKFAQGVPTTTKSTKPSSKWQYSEDVDQMRGTVTRIARIDSENEIDLGSPYTAGKASLVLRERKRDGLSIMLQADGQFVCDSLEHDTVAVKFDSGDVTEWECQESDSGGQGILFIQDGSATSEVLKDEFVTFLRTSKYVTIEANFYQTGRRQMRFRIAGLNWKL
jgi:hypothetical protein